MEPISPIQTCESPSPSRSQFPVARHAFRESGQAIETDLPDSSLHWPNILQILVPTFSAFSVAQGYVHSHADHVDATEDDLARSFDEAELDAMPDEAAERRRRMEEERRGRMCPICLGKPVAGRMTKCGHVSDSQLLPSDSKLNVIADILLPLHLALHPAVGNPQIGSLSDLWRHRSRGNAQVGQVPRLWRDALGHGRRG